MSRLLRYALLTAIAAGIAMGISAIASGQTPYTAADFQRIESRSVRNLRTGIVSKAFCGEDGLGTFFNSGDSQGGSCIAPDTTVGQTTYPAFTVVGSRLYVLIATPSAFRAQPCYSNAYLLCHAAGPGIDQCGKMLLSQLGGPNGIDAAYQVLDVDTMTSPGQSATAGGPVSPIPMLTAVCPTPTIGVPPTGTPTTVPGVPTSTPVPPTAIPPTSTPNPSCPGEIRQLSDGGCYCVATGTRIACPGPEPKPSVTRTFAPPILLTATPLPDTPTPTPTVTPTWTPAPSSTAPPPPTATPSPGSGGGCRSKAATVPIVVPAIAVWMAGWRRKLRREQRNRG